MAVAEGGVQSGAGRPKKNLPPQGPISPTARSPRSQGKARRPPRLIRRAGRGTATRQASALLRIAPPPRRAHAGSQSRFGLLALQPICPRAGPSHTARGFSVEPWRPPVIPSTVRRPPTKPLRSAPGCPVELSHQPLCGRVLTTFSTC